jgi:predicted lipid-binding transport protein (Tim44 family)
MRNKIVRTAAVLLAVLFMSVTVMELNAEARAGSSRSMGSRGTRSYSRPAQSAPSQTSQPRQQFSPSPSPFQQPAGGGFLRSMAGGIAGGLLGGMLFRSLGMAGGGMGGMGGGGIGLFEILLLAGIGYLIYRYVKNRREPAAATGSYNQSNYQATEHRGGYQDVALPSDSYQQVSYEQPGNDLQAGLAHLRQMDPGFDETRFCDTAMDHFFKVQGAWMNRDLAPVSGLLTDEMRSILQQDVDKLKRDRQVNRLENIAVRKVELAEAWQESGQDYLTALITANLLDYTTDESGTVLSGSKTDPVKFAEYWTFTRPVGNNPWKLSAIQQS